MALELTLSLREKKSLESVETYRRTWLGYKENGCSLNLPISILVPQIQGGLKVVPSSDTATFSRLFLVPSSAVAENVITRHPARARARYNNTTIEIDSKRRVQ